MSLAPHKLSENFKSFFKNINPSTSYEEAAASAHSNITSLIESTAGPAGDLRIKCFLQGSYRRDTAIHTINDVDIVALCNLSYSERANEQTRNDIFRMIASAVAEDSHYTDKIRYRKRSLCIKVDLTGVKIEILPAIKVRGKKHADEPFYIFRPDEDESKSGRWETTCAREHQKRCSQKNFDTEQNFIPMIKVIKHLRDVRHDFEPQDAVSFHIECLLYALKNNVYSGSICDVIESVLRSIASFTPDKAKSSDLRNPSGDVILFSPRGWDLGAYRRFNNTVQNWFAMAQKANQQTDGDKAVDTWKSLLGDDYFPRSSK